MKSSMERRKMERKSKNKGRTIRKMGWKDSNSRMIHLDMTFKKINREGIPKALNNENVGQLKASVINSNPKSMKRMMNNNMKKTIIQIILPKEV